MKLKKILRKNEIYFTTITSLLLGIMAIIVAYNANKISEQQSKISYFENTPDFHLSRSYVKDSTGHANEITITLNKYGGKAKNISIQLESFAHFEITDNENNEIDKYVHLYHYFDQTYRTGENNGSIRMIKGFNNNKNFSDLSRLLDKNIRDKGYPFVFINDVIIAKINYTDFLNETREEYYDISFGDGVLLRETDSKIKLFNSSNLPGESISITDVNEDKVPEYLEIIFKKP